MDLIEETNVTRHTAPTAEELAEFRNTVSEWVKYDDQIKKLRIAARERLVHKKALGVQIQEFMERFKYDDLNTQNGRIKHKVRDVKAPLKLTEVKTKLYTIMEDPNTFDDETIKKIQEIFEGERPITKKVDLRRVVPKVSLSLDL